MKLSLSDPVLGIDEKKALCAVIDSQWITMGDRVASFENAFAHAHGAEAAVAVSSCTAALHLGLLALGITAGDEVLVPSLSFVATANAVVYVGAKPVFVDIVEEDCPHLSLSDAEAKCTRQTKAVIVMHYGGYQVDLAEWRTFADQRGLALIEDAAHAPAIGDVGRIADVSAFSFFSNKNMTTAEGGMVIARNPALLETIRSMRSHGMTTLTLDRHRGHAYSYDVTMLGFNYRMDELRAAIGFTQLRKLKTWNIARCASSRHYRNVIADYLPQCTVPFSRTHTTAAHLMPVVLPENTKRDRVMATMRENGVQTSIHYPPIHRFTYYRGMFPDLFLPRTESFSNRVLSLPLHPMLKKEHIEYIVGSLAKAIENA
ncbi:MAG: aminotransferase DegT [Desulfatitalea sp. BRH_c12]|nr:MAG: aminotransferase DegT [Desulfatitalea sp. BRH_c12]